MRLVIIAFAISACGGDPRPAVKVAVPQVAAERAPSAPSITIDDLLAEMIEPAADSLQVADAVSRRVGEGARVDLVDDGVSPPWSGDRCGGTACIAARFACAIVLRRG